MRRKNSFRQPPLLIFLLIVFAGLTALYLAWPAWRTFIPLQIVSSDAWNTLFADRIRLGLPLYPRPNDLIANNYPPLSFYLVSALSWMAGLDALLVGRLLSLFGTIATGIAVFVLTRQLGGSAIGGLVGSLCFVGTSARFYTVFVGINDPHLVALAIMMWALVWFFQQLGKAKPVEPAIMLMVLAGFYKHTLLSVPVAALSYLGSIDLKRGLRGGLVGVGMAALGLALCAVLFGDAFFQNLLMPREYSLFQALRRVGWIQWLAPALGIFAVWAWYQRKSSAARFIGLFVIAAFVNQFVQMTGAGVIHNVHFELAAAAALAVGRAFSGVEDVPFAQRFGLERSRSVIVFILVARLVLTSSVTPYLLLASSDFRTELVQRVAIARSETARIAAIPGPVVCSVMLVCRMAGRPFLFDAFAVSQRIATGYASSAEIDERVRLLGLHFETVDPRTALVYLN